MAKWGEGDPRWVVENRDDGKNVNGWHWEDKNRFAWTKQRLPELFTGVSAELSEDEGSLIVTEVRTVSGEASVMTRKGNKRFAHYELKITLIWEGQLPDADKVKGEIEIDEFSSAHEPDEYIFKVTAGSTGSAQDQCRKIAEGMKGKVLEVLQQYAEELAAT